MKKPDFSPIDTCLHESAWKTWGSKDPASIMSLVGHERRVELLRKNFVPFKDRGIYETALVSAYTHGPCLPPKQWQELFLLADREKLAAAGDPLPTDSVVVYRGITDCALRKWIRGLSWTTNPSTAAWFASRNSSGDMVSAVYSIRVTPADILFATNERLEEELVIAAWQCGKMKRLLQMPPIAQPGENDSNC